MSEVITDGAHAYRRLDGQIFMRPALTKGLSPVDAAWKVPNDVERRFIPPHIVEQLSQSNRLPLQFD